MESEVCTKSNVEKNIEDFYEKYTEKGVANVKED